MNQDPEQPVDFKTRALCGTSMLLISSIGLFLNTLIFYRFASFKKLSSGFYVLCFSKAIGNAIICLINLLWIGPAILIGSLFLPLLANEFLGQLNEYGIYIMGPLTQMLMAIDRFLIIFMPLSVSDRQRCRFSRRSVIGCWIASMIFMGVSFRNNCWVPFSLEELNYKPFNVPCDEFNLQALSFLCIFLAVTSSSLQFLTLLRLLVLFSNKAIHRSSTNRRRRTIRLFVQSVIQDCLHCLDLLNSNNYFGFETTIGHFFIYTFSLVFVHATDGLIMCLFHFAAASNRKSAPTSRIVRVTEEQKSP